ncbi:hypothetical protein PEC302110_19920 [Pectobacterium araliae]|uniref:Uncharacterized protein n=1 Tax=Pectobacterium araliae TaxID=3073862 RepID=A0AAN0KCB7_9GAMM|nr:hypothetical protein PEC302110_19920 [Pectobacterium sp. MAFF 302110]
MIFFVDYSWDLCGLKNNGELIYLFDEELNNYFSLKKFLTIIEIWKLNNS